MDIDSTIWGLWGSKEYLPANDCGQQGFGLSPMDDDPAEETVRSLSPTPPPAVATDSPWGPESRKNHHLHAAAPTKQTRSLRAFCIIKERMICLGMVPMLSFLCMTIINAMYQLSNSPQVKGVQNYLRLGVLFKTGYTGSEPYIRIPAFVSHCYEEEGVIALGYVGSRNEQMKRCCISLF